MKMLSRNTNSSRSSEEPAMMNAVRSASLRLLVEARFTSDAMRFSTKPPSTFTDRSEPKIVLVSNSRTAAFGSTAARVRKSGPVRTVTASCAVR
jgi:hypothetical protein